MRVIIQPGDGQSMAALMREISDTIPDRAAGDLTVGNGGVVLTEEDAHHYLAAILGHTTAAGQESLENPPATVTPPRKSTPARKAARKPASPRTGE